MFFNRMILDLIVVAVLGQDSLAFVSALGFSTFDFPD